MKHITTFKLIGGLLLAAPLLAACNTVDGVGQDVSAVGKGVSHVSNEVSDELFGGYHRRDQRGRAVQRTTYVQPQRTVYAPAPAYRTGTATAGQPCDPYATELSGGGLPPCRTQTTRRYR